MVSPTAGCWTVSPTFGWLLFPVMVQRAWLTHPTPDTSYVVKGNRAYPSGLPVSSTWRLCPFKYRKGSSLYSPLPLASQGHTQSKIQWTTWRTVKLLEP